MPVLVICEQVKKASLVGAFFLFGAFTQAQADVCPVPRLGAAVQVERVVDGDTVRLADGRSVRLIGINAPELRPRGRSPEPFAEQARRRLQALIAANNGQVQVYPQQPQRDHYGRPLVHLFDAQGRNLEARLLEEGLGYFVAFAPATSLAACQLAAEQRARAQGLGLWRQAQVLTPARLSQSGFSVVQGRVTSIERNRAGVWIELDHSMVLRIEPKKLSFFNDLLQQGLQGRWLEARGWVVDRYQRSANRRFARWLMTLSDPLMLTVKN